MSIETMKLALEALETFEYKEGVLYWKNPVAIRLKAGDPAGTLANNGYLRTHWKEKFYLNHRLIWLMHNKELPEFIDHIDGDRLNNRIENLRSATASQNQHNQKLRSNNKSGVKGVSWANATKKWRVQMKVNGKLKHIGLFDDLNVAKQVAETTRNEIHKEFANHG